MIPRLCRHRAVWALAAALPLGLLAASGCDQDQYSRDILYPLRDDPAVETPTEPSVQPRSFDLPGEFPHVLLSALERLPENSGTRIDLPGKHLDAKERGRLQQDLNGIFGRPAEPTVQDYVIKEEKNRPALEIHLDPQALELLRLDPTTLDRGSELYRRHCLQCHGLTGNGRGHTAPWINPHPRDFRKGMFKFTSSSQNQGPARKARREDLLRTLRLGVEGTAMPAFGILPPEELEVLASYVIHLSLRGETEQYATFQRGDQSVDEAVASGLESFVGRWREAQANVIRPPAYDPDMAEPQRLASVTRGYQFFSTNCLSCHENYGRREVYKYDAWGTIVRPADLTAGIYRGGRRPIDLYWRIHAGINGAQMPATVPSAMRPEQVWDVVSFVRALPYPPMLPPDIRGQIYPPDKDAGRSAE